MQREEKGKGHAFPPALWILAAGVLSVSDTSPVASTHDQCVSWTNCPATQAYRQLSQMHWFLVHSFILKVCWRTKGAEARAPSSGKLSMMDSNKRC
ncbi:hypothetical protein DFH11DRAFT_904656 [Phellopilus nigrolimitatus]|nr:hypothetical protein DFH11DRAFT_904656 [Phellopilus nigrolimitatus]